MSKPDPNSAENAAALAAANAQISQAPVLGPTQDRTYSDKVEMDAADPVIQKHKSGDLPEILIKCPTCKALNVHTGVFGRSYETVEETLKRLRVAKVDIMTKCAHCLNVVYWNHNNVMPTPAAAPVVAKK